MALRVDRPAGGAGDELVVYVARRLEDARRAREALVAAGVAVDLPDAALEALFAGGAATVPVKVPARDFSRAVDVIDAAFPPAEVVLPPATPARPGPGPDAADRRAPDLGDGGAPDLTEATRRAGERALERSAGKVALIAGGSLLLPGPGLPFALFALASGLWCLARVREVGDARTAERARRRALVGTVLAAAATVASLGVIAAWLAHR